MSTNSTDAEKHLFALFREFDTAFLTTRSLDGGMHGRPMGLAEVKAGESIWFSAGLDSPKVKEIEVDGTAHVSVQGKTKWAALRGHARVCRDRAKIDELWRDSWRLWFPEGKDDPNLCLIELQPSEGEYWDNSGLRGVRFAIEAVKALAGVRTPDVKNPDENAKVAL